MNTANIKKYAPLARNAFITAVTKRANELGIYDSHIEEAKEEGQVLKIEGRSVDLQLKGARNKLISQVESTGFTALMEHVAYTWFNRLCAIRYMELHDYLDHGIRVLSHPDNENSFEILEHAQDVAEELGLNRDQIIELKLAGNQDELLYRTLLLGQCHALHKAMPFLFEAIDDETELLLPDNLTRTDSILRGLVNDIPTEDWQQVEVIGWLYQFYISEKKDEVIGKVVKSEDIPAATQLFTPNWIVKYLVQNSVGRQWLQTYPDSSIKAGMEYYIEPAEQTDEVNQQIKAITPASIEPESIKVLDPACGSGHILVEAYQVLKAIYKERGYRSRDIPQLILENNLFGLDIDDRAAQLAGFALMMLARADDRRIFTRDVQLNVMAMQSTAGISLQSDDCLVIQDEQQRQVFVQIVRDLLALFEQAKSFGSLIEVPEHIVEYLSTAETIIKQLAESGDLFSQNVALTLMPIIKQTEILSRKYDAVVANPPYLAAKSFNKDLKEWMKVNYKGFDKDLFSAFMVRNLNLTKSFGHCGVMTSFVWMFISTFENLRVKLLSESTIQSLIQLHYDAFTEAKAHIMTCVFSKELIEDFFGNYIRLAEISGADNQAPMTIYAIKNSSKCDWFYTTKQRNFFDMPSTPIAYWASDNIKKCFSIGQKLGDVIPVKKGMDTGNNDLFLRLWHEIDYSTFGEKYKTSEDLSNDHKKWVPYDKGGYFRKWYGNNEYVLNWENNGETLRSSSANLRSERLYFKESITWCALTSTSTSARYSMQGSIFDSAGSSMFPNERDFNIYLSLMNSSAIDFILKMLNPTLNYGAGSISNIPLVNKSELSFVIPFVKKLVKIFKEDWDCFEGSYGFKKNSLVCNIQPELKLNSSFVSYYSKTKEQVALAFSLEQKCDQIVVEAYGLTEEVNLSSQPTSLLVNPRHRYGVKGCDKELENRFQSDTLAELISYAIGCMMGRYSLDQEGLVYAHADNEGFTELEQQGVYKTFPVDDDGIIPLTDQEWFADDASHRFREFVRVVWGEDNLQQNLDFVAESLCLYAIKAKGGETSLDTIRRYLSTQFYKDHLKTYKKRPIYWLFSSGKQKAFECLVYLHRYNESTLSRLRTEYVTPLLGKYEASAMVLDKQMQDASTTAESNRFKKSLTALEKKQTELSEFDNKLKHYADMRISLDLDDGVKVNYGRFGDLLAEVKTITGKK